MNGNTSAARGTVQRAINNNGQSSDARPFYNPAHFLFDVSLNAPGSFGSHPEGHSGHPSKGELSAALRERRQLNGDFIQLLRAPRVTGPRNNNIPIGKYARTLRNVKTEKSPGRWPVSASWGTFVRQSSRQLGRPGCACSNSSLGTIVLSAIAEGTSFRT